MAKDKMYGKTLRKNFARHEEIMEMPNLLELQKKSYRWFLDEGLEKFLDVQFEKAARCNIDYDKEGSPRKDIRYVSPAMVQI